MFKVGDKAVYPAHGLGVVKEIVTRAIGGCNQEFYVLQIQSSGATLMVPVNFSDRAGMRPIISKKEIEKIYELLSKSPKTASYTSWSKRFRHFNSKLQDGGLEEVAEILRDLYKLKSEQDLSYGEKKMMDKALTMLVSEISAATGVDGAVVEKDLLKRIKE